MFIAIWARLCNLDLVSIEEGRLFWIKSIIGHVLLFSRIDGISINWWHCNSFGNVILGNTEFYQRFKIYPRELNNTGLTSASIYYATAPKSVCSVFLGPLNSMLDSFNILLSLRFRSVLDNIEYSDSAKTRNSITRTIITQADHTRYRLSAKIMDAWRC